MKLNVIYLDNHLLVCEKPAGLLSQSDITGDIDLLTLGKNHLKSRFQRPGNVFLGLVHRLDRPASGLMVFARTSKAAARLCLQFKNRNVSKHYFAIVEGHPPVKGVLEDHMLKDGRSARIVKKSHPKGKSAKLEYEVIAKHGWTSLVSIKLHTGRPHQIRLQFSSREFPLLGDKRYGAERSFQDNQLALHSWQLGFEHPTKKEEMKWILKPSWGDWYSDEIATFFKDK